MKKFPKCYDVLAKLEEPPQNSTVEHELEVLQGKSDDYEIPRQLASIRLYLREMIWECVARWMDATKGASNYRVLLNSIRAAKSEDETCLVTFNYDTMLEDALRTRGKTIRRIEDYVPDMPFYKTIKLHGSVNWVHPVSSLRRDAIASMTDIEVAQQLIGDPPVLDEEEKNVFEIVESPVSKKGDRAFVPALAIPTETKRSYECPQHHIDVLTKHLPEVTKIIVIGWAANEDNFLKLLAQSLKDAPRTIIVAGSAKGGNEVKEKLLRAGIHFTSSSITVTQGGFSNFVRGEADRFLS
jgi:hypothetical protein